MQADKLHPIDGNARSNTTNTLDPLDSANSKPAPAFAQESQQHKFLHSQLLKQQQSGKQTGTYVSPSDDILSPASAKLNAFKEKRFTKSAKPRTLFAKTSSYSSDGSSQSIDEMMAGRDKIQRDLRLEGDVKMSEG